MTVGTLEAAARVLAGLLPYFDEGSTRKVYRLGNVVYKVPYDEHGYHFNDSSIAEFDNISSITLPDGYAFPDTALFDVDGTPVIAMEYIDGIQMSECWCNIDNTECDSSCLPDFVMRDLRAAGISDFGGTGNVIYSDGTYYVVDAAV